MADEQLSYALLEVDSANINIDTSNATNASKASSNQRRLCIVIICCLAAGGAFICGIMVGRGISCDCSEPFEPTPSATSTSSSTPPTTSPTSLPTVDGTASLVEIELAQSILSAMNLEEEFLNAFNHAEDMYFDYALDDYQVYGGKITATPQGWVKFGLSYHQNITGWSKGYHGTLLDTIPKIFASNLTLLKVGDTIPGTNMTIKPRPGHITKGYTRFNEYTQTNEEYDPTDLVFLTPSIRYAQSSVYAPEYQYNDTVHYQVVFEVAMRNVSDINIGQSTTPAYKCADGIIQSNQIEWYTKYNLRDLVLTGMLIKTRITPRFEVPLYNEDYIYLNDKSDTITRKKIKNGTLYSAQLPVVSSGYHEWLFLIKHMTNHDEVAFGMVDETSATYLWTAKGKKGYLKTDRGKSYYAPFSNVQTVRMIADFHKHEVRFVINKYDYDVAFPLPQREMKYYPTVWLGNNGDQVQVI